MPSTKAQVSAFSTLWIAYAQMARNALLRHWRDALILLAVLVLIASQSQQATGAIEPKASHNIGFLEGICDDVHLLNANEIKATFKKDGEQTLEEFYRRHT